MKTWNTPSVTVCTAAELQKTIQAKAWSEPISLDYFLSICHVGTERLVQDSETYWPYTATCLSESGNFFKRTKVIQKNRDQTSTWEYSFPSPYWHKVVDWH